MKGVTADLFSTPLRRVRHDGRHASVVYNDPRSDAPMRRGGRPPARRIYGSRLNDGSLWASAAWAELAGLEPFVRYHTHNGSQRIERPWRDREAALAFLHAMLDSHTGRVTARRRLVDLLQRGVITEDEARLR